MLTHPRFPVNVNAASSWEVVKKLQLVVTSLPRRSKKKKFLIYGSADPMPNPAELLITQKTSIELGFIWRFFVYQHGKNLSLTIPDNYQNPPGVFYLEDIIPHYYSLRDLAKSVFQLRQEPVIIAHWPDGRAIRATTTRLKDIPDISIASLHQMGGWLGGSGIHYFLRLYAENNFEILYICPFQEKGRVYEIYKGINRPLFVLSPFVRLCPPPNLVKEGWEPLSWDIWRQLPSKARFKAYQLVSIFISNNMKYPLKIKKVEIPWGWWL